MKKIKTKLLKIILIFLSVISVVINVYAHSGRTDANGGHRDTKNKSGLGSYHYHCGGNPAHLHPNGVCPYSSSNSKTTTTTSPATVSVTGIQINEKIDSMELGKSKVLTATITPSNATDKNISWKSSNENVATISSLGEVVAKQPGTVNITATSSNGKTSTIKITVKEETKRQNDNIVKTSTISKNNTNNSISSNNQEDGNSLGSVIALSLLGGGGYLIYKKNKYKS